MIDWSAVPNPAMTPGLRRYYEQGVMPGAFLRSLLENNFALTVMGADDHNAALLLPWARWLYNDFEPLAYGSKAIVQHWCEHGGLPGVLAVAQRVMRQQGAAR